LPPRYKLALDSLTNLIAGNGKPVPKSFALPTTVRAVVEIDRWRDELFAKGIIERDDANPRETFRRIKRGLPARKMIDGRDAHVWPAS
jgi:hypothetical protein